MPSTVGNIKIVSVSTSSIVHIGDSIVLAPVSTSKSYAGTGSFNNGDLPTIRKFLDEEAPNPQSKIQKN